jgi:hypothetical protein
MVRPLTEFFQTSFSSNLLELFSFSERFFLNLTASPVGIFPEFFGNLRVLFFPLAGP